MAWHLLGMLSTSFSAYSVGRERHTSLIRRESCFRVNARLPASFLFTTLHTFSIGFASRDCPDVIFRFPGHAEVTAIFGVVVLLKDPILIVLWEPKPKMTLRPKKVHWTNRDVIVALFKMFLSLSYLILLTGRCSRFSFPSQVIDGFCVPIPIYSHLHEVLRLFKNFGSS